MRGVGEPVQADAVVAPAGPRHRDGGCRVGNDAADRVAFSLAVVADVMETRLPALTELSCFTVIPAVVNGRVGGLGDARQSRDDEDAVVRRAAQRVVHDALARIRASEPPPRRLPSDLVSAAAMWEQRGHGLGAATSLCCAAHDALAQQFEQELEIAVDDLALRWECARVARARVADSRTQVLELLRRWYESSRGRRLGQMSRSAVVKHVLATAESTGDELGYDLDRGHVGLAACTAPPIDALARRTGLDLLLVPGGEGVGWGWLSGSRTALDVRLEEVVSSARKLPGKVAMGEPGTGIAGFRSSHSQAVEAWRVLGSMPSGPTVLRFAEAAPVIALMRDRDLARCFISHELGRLPRSLQETAKAYMEAGQNAVAAAARTRRSRSTVERQLRRIEEILGQPFRDRGASLMIAMQACAIARAEGWWGDS